jgi:hypothetical protein
VLLSTGAQAQGRTECGTPQPPTVGLSFGRSDPYLELQADAYPADDAGTVSVRRAGELAGRLDLPLAGAFRVRVEGARASWDVRRRLYDASAGFRLVSDESIDHISARHATALVGVRTGHAPACAFVGAGVGFYTIGFRDVSLRSPGFAGTVGMEIPAGPHGVVQVDATIHLIQTGNREPIGMSTVPVLSLLAGYAYRF